MNALNQYLEELPSDFKYKHMTLVDQLGPRLEAEMEDLIREVLKRHEAYDDNLAEIEMVANRYGRTTFFTEESALNAPPRSMHTWENITGIIPDHSIRIERRKFSHYLGKHTVFLIRVIVIEIYEPSRLITG